MKHLVLVLSLVIFGVSHCDIVKYQRTIILNGLVDAVMNYTLTPTYHKSQLNKAVYSYLCEDAGELGPDFKIKGPLGVMQSCVEAVAMNTSNLESWGPKEKVLDFCRVVDELDKCSIPYTNDHKPCEEAPELYNTERERNMTNAIKRFVCDNDAERVVALVAGEASVCVESKKPQFQTCYSAYEKKELEMESAKMSAEDEQEADCKNMEVFIQCAKTALHSCPNQGPANFFDGITDAAFEYWPCTRTPVTTVEKPVIVV